MKILRHTFPKILIGLASACVLALVAMPATAQTGAWPQKPVRIIAPYPAGSLSDVQGRLLAKRLGDVTGQGFIVENRAGANGNVGSAYVASAAPDGYTLLFTTNGPLVHNKFIYKNANFDPAKDFTPIVKVSAIPLLIAAHPSFPAKNLTELIQYAQANPGKVTYATNGNGTMAHLAAELLQRRAGIELTHVPHSTTLSLNSVLAGVVNLSFDLLPTYVQHVQGGKLKALAVTTLERSLLLPDVATLSEQGMKDLEATAWNGLVAPVGTPLEVIQKVNGIINAYIASDVGKEALRGLGLQAGGGTPQQMGDYMAAQAKIWQPIASLVKVE